MVVTVNQLIPFTLHYSNLSFSFWSEFIFLACLFVIHTVYLSLVLITPGQINQVWFVLIVGLIRVQPPLMTLSVGGVDYEDYWGKSGLCYHNLLFSWPLIGQFGDAMNQ